MLDGVDRAGPSDAPGIAYLGASVAARLKDLYAPSAVVYWVDFLGSAVAGWALFCITVASRDLLVAGTSIAVSMVLLYRAHLFVHELSHAARRIAGFSMAWNLLAGFPLFVPSSFAVGVHTHHHNRRTYGTARDPEYLPFGFSRMLILQFVLINLVFPEIMALRFVIAGPVGLLIPPFQRILERHATSLAMNPAFVREVGTTQHRTIVRQQFGLLAVWLPVLALFATGKLEPRAVWCWLVLATGIALLNGIRTLVAHQYLGKGTEFDRLGQVQDSIDIPGSWWTGLWAPVGHRYHALHHLAPALPYHNLGVAYRRLSSRSSSQSPLAVSRRKSLLGTLAQLWIGAGQTEQRPG